MRTWPVWKAPWTVPLYAADVCSPAKKSLPPTLPPKAAVMVSFDVPAMIERLRAAQGKLGERHSQRRQRWVGDAPTATYVYAPFACGLARQVERIISGIAAGTVTELGKILTRFARICE